MMTFTIIISIIIGVIIMSVILEGTSDAVTEQMPWE
jgi:hypothetical protein